MSEVQIPWQSSARFVKVFCRLGLVTSDAGDADVMPDLMTASGKVTISMDVKHVRYQEDVRSRMLMTPGTIYTVDPKTGELVDPHGNVGLYILDPLSPGIDPTGFTYTARVEPTGGELWTVTFGGDVQLPAEVDLVTLATVPASSGTAAVEQRLSAVEGAVQADDAIVLTDTELNTALGVV